MDRVELVLRAEESRHFGPQGDRMRSINEYLSAIRELDDERQEWSRAKKLPHRLLEIPRRHTFTIVDRFASHKKERQSIISRVIFKRRVGRVCETHPTLMLLSDLGSRRGSPSSQVSFWY